MYKECDEKESYSTLVVYRTYLNMPNCFYRSLPDRYKNISDVAKTRSVLSLGLSCFKLQTVEQTTLNRDQPLPGAVPDAHVQVREWSFNVQTFNVTLLCSEDYMVEPGALKFLVEHGFDFNKQYASGVSYYRGKGKVGVFAS